MSYHKDNIYDVSVCKGKRQGVYKTYFDTEGLKIWRMGSYKDDIPSGRWTSFTEDGRVEFEEIYFSDWDKVSLKKGRDEQKGFVEKLTYYFTNGKVVEFNIPFDNKEYYQSDCSSKYWFKLMSEKSNIENGNKQLWEDNKWNIDRGLREEYNDVKHDVEEGEIKLITEGEDK